MNKYKTLDGKIVEANSDKQLIEKLREDSFTESTDLKDFMVQTSRRCYEYDKSNIRIDTHENFINDMIKGGFLTKI